MNGIDPYGLKVINIIPEAYSTDASINSKIEINFNLELDSSTIVGSIFIVEDLDRIIDIESPEIKEDCIVDGTFTYKDRTVYFMPKEQLKVDCRYCVIVNKEHLKDIHGRYMSKDITRYFDTEGSNRFEKTNIIEPANNSILLEVLNASCTDVGADKYLFQISKSKTFPNIILENYSDSNAIEILPLPDGLYFIRAKAINGDYGETSSFTVKSYKDTLPVDEDFSEDFFYEEAVQDSVTFEKAYPEDGEINVSEKTNVTYMVFDGELDVDKIDFYSSGIYGELSDEDDYEQIEPHGYVDCAFNIIYDDVNDKSYIVYIPIEIGGDIND